MFRNSQRDLYLGKNREFIFVVSTFGTFEGNLRTLDESTCSLGTTKQIRNIHSGVEEGERIGKFRVD